MCEVVKKKYEQIRKPLEDALAESNKALAERDEKIRQLEVQLAASKEKA